MNRALHSFAADAQPHVSALPERESLPLEEALELLLQRTPTVAESEEVPLFDADGRICFAHMRAELPQPPYNRVQVDGYALRSSDIASATAERPAMLLVTQHLYAGDAPGQPLEPGQAARVTTGAVLPPGADCVVWQEDTLADGQTVVISRSLAAMRNCRMCGQDMERGSTLAESGDVLHSGTLSLLAGQGHTHVRVFRRPRVSLLATGSELVLPGAPLPQGGVYNISSTLLGVRLRKMGTRILRMMTRGDNRQALQELLAEMLAESDLVITTGGASVGPKDLVPGIASEIVAEQGGSMLFQSLRLKPGSMTLAAALPQTLLLGLSGNPVAAAATFGLLAVPVLKKMGGATRFAPLRQKAVARNDFGSCRKDERRIVLARLEGRDVYFARDAQRMGQPALCDDCNCFVDIPAGSAPLRKGMEVDVILA
ncbi:molybdopterin molybdotransferase MoeA [Desulfovibrio sp.]|uniref:molybdopterin molybdotransferase MoeA n=1 Tax=Desulfovibrio sp. TaxID=885 RepID=UPI002621FE41|nr:molybdopterin molybdotransferase MoeA [Desulfovibrio sp.]